MSDEENTRIIDLVGYVKSLWAHSVIFVTTLVVIASIGAAWVFTRPAQYEITQTVMISLPSVETEADANQQTAWLTATVQNYVKLLSLPTVAQPVLDAHDVASLEQLRAIVSVESTAPLTIELQATGEDADALGRLISDMAESWVDAAPTLIPHHPEPLSLTLVIVDGPVITAAATGRLIRLAASGLVALILATTVTAAAAGIANKRRS